MELTLSGPWYRSRLSYNADQAITGAASVCGAIVAVAVGAAPTGQAAIDAVLVFVGVALVALAAGTAPRRLLAAIACLVALIAAAPILTSIGLAAGLLAYASEIRHRDESAPGALIAAIVLNVMLRWELEGFFGLTSLLGIGLAVPIVVAGILGVERETRRRCIIGASLALAALVTVVIGAGVTARSAAHDISIATARSEQAAQRLEAGDHAAATSLLESSADRFGRANGHLKGLFGHAAQAVPVIAQHVRAGQRLSAAAEDSVRASLAAVTLADPDALRVRDGRIDIESVEAIESPVDDLVESLEAARRTIDDVDSPWLVAPVRRRLDDASETFDTRRAGLELAADGVRLAPGLLGAEGERNYLVLFTTPSEARGLGGFVGNYAEITVDEGRIDVTALGRRHDLELGLDRRGARCTGCAEQFLESFGRFGIASGPDGSALPRSWSNLTMSPHFPDVAQAAAVLYPQSGGQPIDGVIAMDPYVLETLMESTGPVTLREMGVTVEPDRAAEFILRDQYVLAGDDAQLERVDALDQLASVVIEKLLAGALPGPLDLARDLGPLFDERRLVVWSATDDEQALFVRARIDGGLPSPENPGRFAVTVDNASANKIETFLERTVTFETEQSAGGRATTIAVVTLRNGAPASGLPNYVIGNEVGLPRGSSRTLVSFYSPDDDAVMTIERDGEEVETERGSLSGWSTRRHFIDLVAGQSTTYRIDLGLDVGTDPARVVAWEQPLARS